MPASHPSLRAPRVSSTRPASAFQSISSISPSLPLASKSLSPSPSSHLPSPLKPRASTQSQSVPILASLPINHLPMATPPRPSSLDKPLIPSSANLPSAPSCPGPLLDSTVLPATPPKPRVSDDDNAFHAFHLEHSKLDLDLMITYQAPTHDPHQPHSSLQSPSRPKLSMAHVEMVMDELENSRMNDHPPPRSWNHKIQIHCSLDDASDHTIIIADPDQHHHHPTTPSLPSTQPISRQEAITTTTNDDDPTIPPTDSRDSSDPSHDDPQASIDRIRTSPPDRHPSSRCLIKGLDQSILTSHPSSTVIHPTFSSTQPHHHHPHLPIVHRLASQSPSQPEPEIIVIDDSSDSASASFGPSDPPKLNPTHPGPDPHHSSCPSKHHVDPIHPFLKPSPLPQASRSHTSSSHSFKPARPDQTSENLVSAVSQTWLKTRTRPPRVAKDPDLRTQREAQADKAPVLQFQEELKPDLRSHELRPDPHPSTSDLSVVESNHDRPSTTVIPPISSLYNPEGATNFLPSFTSPPFFLPHSQSHHFRRLGPVSESSATSDADHSVDQDEHTFARSGRRDLNHLTSTPYGFSQPLSPFPCPKIVRVHRSLSSDPSIDPRPIVEVTSTNPKVAARAAAILSVHHGFVPRGFKAQSSSSFSLINDDLEKEMEESFRKELETAASERSITRPTSLAPSTSRSLAMTERKIQDHHHHHHHHHHHRDHSSSSFNDLTPSTNRTRMNEISDRSGACSPSAHHSQRTDTPSSPSVRQDHDRRRDQKKKKSLKQELREIKYRPDFQTWTATDWKVLEFCLRRLERNHRMSAVHGDLHHRHSSETSESIIVVEPKDVVLSLLQSLDLQTCDCQLEWEWTKMIHRVMALQKRRSNKLKRFSSSSASSSTRYDTYPHHSSCPLSSAYHPPVDHALTRTVKSDVDRANEISDHEHEQNPAQDQDRLGATYFHYPSLEPLRRMLSKGRTTLAPIDEPEPSRTSSAPIGDEPKPSESTRRAVEVELGVPCKISDGIKSSDYPPSRPRSPSSARVPPPPPPLSAEFRRRWMAKVEASWESKRARKRRFGHGMIWEVVDRFEDRIDQQFRTLLRSFVPHPFPGTTTSTTTTTTTTKRPLVRCPDHHRASSSVSNPSYPCESEPRARKKRKA